jgi:signal transduction histidine kinase/CheY-like chemotaxis protein/HPt (histidine-containing phosphotransfer) domain-containing protein
MGGIGPSLLGVALASGITLYLAILHLALGRNRSAQTEEHAQQRTNTMHRWSAGWSALALVTNVCRGLQYVTDKPRVVILCAAFSLVTEFWLLFCFATACYSLCNEPMPKRLGRGLVGFALLGSVLSLWPDLLVSSRVAIWTDLLGQRFLRVEPQPWLFPVTLGCLGLYVFLMRTILWSKSLLPTERVFAAVALVMFLAIGVNDGLIFALGRRGVLLWEYGNLLLTLLLDVLGIRLFRRLYRELSLQVETRTKALEQINADLLRSAEEARSAAWMKSIFLANMSHELRTPLNAVIGYTSLLLEAPLARQQLEQVQAVRTAADALLHQINNILDLSKVEVGKLELENAHTDLNLAMEDAVEIVAEVARKKQLGLTCLLSPGCPTHLLSDPGRLRQVLINIIGNAVKFTDSGEVIVRASQVKGGGKRGEPVLRIEVTDTGPGIAADSLPRLFELFSQVDASSARRHGGTGLGLALCKRVIEAMGGAIGVDSTVGVGSTFWFTLPLLQRATAPSEMEMLPIMSAGSQILVVDGHEPTRAQLQQQLIALSLRPILCSSLAEGDMLLCREWGALPAALLLSDEFPPSEQERFLQKELPVVLLTRSRKKMESTPVPGLAGQLLKPLRIRRVARMLRHILSGLAKSSRIPSRLQSGIAMRRSNVMAPRLLVAEDNPANQRLAAEMLSRIGCRVDVVSNGLEAIQAAHQFEYDLILMDCQMPEMDGLSATREIRRSSKGHSPIIALTANAFKEDEENSRAAGMSDFMTKPMTIDALRLMLAKWLPQFFTLGENSSLDSAAHPVVTMPTELAPRSELQMIRDKRQELTELMGEDTVAQMRTLFKTETVRSIASAKAQLQAGDLEGLRKTVHRLAGAALGMGAELLAKHCLRLQEAARTGNQDASGPLLAQIAEQAERVIEAL